MAEAEASQLTEIERELDATRKELQSAIRDLELSNEEQKAINEEALSVNEEFQSTNEELETSKEELQSLNEELTALNSQLHETVEQQRITANDLQNVLNSANVATIFLDGKLNIRFFTPAVRSHFSIVATDVGRPLADLASRSDDKDLLVDAAAVLANAEPLSREIERDRGIMVSEAHPALSRAGRPDRGRGHHLRRHFRAEGGATRNRSGAGLFQQHRRDHSPAARGSR